LKVWKRKRSNSASMPNPPASSTLAMRRRAPRGHCAPQGHERRTHRHCEPEGPEVPVKPVAWPLHRETNRDFSAQFETRRCRGDQHFEPSSARLSGQSPALRRNRWRFRVRSRRRRRFIARSADSVSASDDQDRRRSGTARWLCSGDPLRCGRQGSAISAFAIGDGNWGYRKVQGRE
jgi:hypothetical protein